MAPGSDAATPSAAPGCGTCVQASDSVASVGRTTSTEHDAWWPTRSLTLLSRTQATQAAASDDQEIGFGGRGEERRDRGTVVTLAFHLCELVERRERGVVRRYDTNSGVEPLGEITGDAECGAGARRSVIADHDRMREGVGRARLARDQHRRAGAMEHLGGDVAEYDSDPSVRRARAHGD